MPDELRQRVLAGLLKERVECEWAGALSYFSEPVAVDVERMGEYRASGYYARLNFSANQTREDDGHRAMTAWAIRSESDDAILRTIRLAASDPRVRRTADEISGEAAA